MLFGLEHKDLWELQSNNRFDKCSSSMYSSKADQYFCWGKGMGGVIVLKVKLFICVSRFPESSVSCLSVSDNMLSVRPNFSVNALLNHIALKIFASHNMSLCL